MGECPEYKPFQPLEFRRTPWTRWISSLVINGGVVLAIFAIPATVTTLVEAPAHLSVETLIVPPQPRPKIPTKIRPIVRPRNTEVAVSKPPRVQFKAPVVRETRSKIAIPEAPAVAPSPPQLVTLPRDAPKIDLPPRPQPQVNVFAQPTAAVAQASAKVVRTGGFGDPNGARPSPASSRKTDIAAVGLFDAPAGEGHEKASAGGGRSVASAGFGTGIASAGPPTAHATVQKTSFGEVAPTTAPGTAQKAVGPSETPVEITYKPKPAYTPDAREKKIEGEVQLEVLFLATGEVRVLRVIRGLGYGLDENARTAASRIRFHPGTRNGTPVDTTGTIHIVFELS